MSRNSGAGAAITLGSITHTIDVYAHEAFKAGFEAGRAEGLREAERAAAEPEAKTIPVDHWESMENLRLARERAEPEAETMADECCICGQSHPVPGNCPPPPSGVER